MGTRAFPPSPPPQGGKREKRRKKRRREERGVHAEDVHIIERNLTLFRKGRMASLMVCKEGRGKRKKKKGGGRWPASL